MKKFVLILLCLAGLFTVASAQNKPSDVGEKKPVEKANTRPAEKEKKKEPFDDADVKTMAAKCVLIDTEKGKITLEMYPESAPETVRSFLNLVASGALDTTTFSRVVPDFIIQGGDLYTSEKLTNALKWRAVKTIPDEPNRIIHDKGIISMARSPEPNSATTNFFILLSPAKTLDGLFAAFGKVVKGLETVETINKMKVENEKPKEPVKITKATVETCVVKETPEKVEKPRTTEKTRDKTNFKLILE